MLVQFDSVIGRPTLGNRHFGPTIDQFTGAEQNDAPDTTVVPFMYQMAFSPVTVFLHAMSGLPSPLKSATPTIDHFVGAELKAPPPVTVVPFRYQIAS
jgi:hypothetical protein